MCMDNIKSFAKNKKLEILMQTIRLYCQDIGTELSIEKCAMLIMKSGKREIREGMEQIKKESEFVEKRKITSTWKYWKCIPSNKWRWKEKKEKKRVSQMNKNTTWNQALQQKSKDCAVPHVRYSGLFSKWTKEELRQIGQSKRKLMTMNQVLHLRDDIDRLYVSRKGGGRELANLEGSVEASIQGLEDNIKKSKERWITAVSNGINNIRTNWTITRKQKWEEKQLYGYFKQQTEEISH